MLARLFLFCTILPLLELYVLIQIGNSIGALNTVLLVLGTALLGAFLIRREGIRTLRQITGSLSRGIMPAEEMIDGMLIFLAGILLVTPGVFTDVLALGLLIPFTRRIFKRWLRRRFDRMNASRKFRTSLHSRLDGDP